MPDLNFKRHWTSKLLLALPTLVIVATLGGASSCTYRSADQRQANPTSSPSPAVAPRSITADSQIGWLMADNERHTAADYRGKVLVLDFYATWCAPCRDSIPHLVSLQNLLGPKGMQIVGLNVGGADDRVKVAQFARELGVNYPLGFPDQAVTELFLSDDQTIPQTFVFGRDGRLIKRLIGYHGPTTGELEQAITSGLATK